jgi:hypothetical protein
MVFSPGGSQQQISALGRSSYSRRAGKKSTAETNFFLQDKRGKVPSIPNFNKMRILAVILTTMAMNTLGACSHYVQKSFDSKEWKMGTPSSRGAMVQDLIDRKILLGKTSSEVEELLGGPDFRETNWFGYKVVTIPRCRLWECRMDVVFDAQLGTVKSVAVSD